MPQTLIGRIVAAFCMVTGIIVLLCLPTPVFVTHFGRFYDDVIREEKNKEIDNNSVFNEKNKDEENSADSLNAEIWQNHDSELIVPAWVNDSSWKYKIRNDLQQNLSTKQPPALLSTSVSGLNAYLSSSNLFLSSRACSPEPEFQHMPQHASK